MYKYMHIYTRYIQNTKRRPPRPGPEAWAKGRPSATAEAVIRLLRVKCRPPVSEWPLHERLLRQIINTNLIKNNINLSKYIQNYTNICTYIQDVDKIPSGGGAARPGPALRRGPRAGHQQQWKP